MTIAQTSVELFNQLQDQGLSTGDLQRLRGAYGFAMTLFAGRMHPSGKPYLAHCVGAASAVASIGAPTDVVAAALLHGAYRLGDFGARRIRLASKRRCLQRALGDAAETYVHRFAQQPWRTDAIAALRDQCGALDATTRTTVLIRLASELDNVRDRAPLFCADAEARHDALRVRSPLLIELADRLPVPQPLRDALAAALAEVLRADVPASLRWSGATEEIVPPASARQRWQVSAVAVVRAVARRMQRRGTSAAADASSVARE